MTVMEDGGVEGAMQACPPVWKKCPPTPAFSSWSTTATREAKNHTLLGSQSQEMRVPGQNKPSLESAVQPLEMI